MINLNKKPSLIFDVCLNDVYSILNPKTNKYVLVRASQLKGGSLYIAGAFFLGVVDDVSGAEPSMSTDKEMYHFNSGDNLSMPQYLYVKAEDEVCAWYQMEDFYWMIKRKKYYIGN